MRRACGDIRCLHKEAGSRPCERGLDMRDVTSPPFIYWAAGLRLRGAYKNPGRFTESKKAAEIAQGGLERSIRLNCTSSAIQQRDKHP